MNLQEQYNKEIVPKLMQDRGYTNRLQVPRVTKVTINVGLGAGIKDAKYLETAEQTLRRISGQQPVKTKARISISNFKIRKGMVIGMKVTVRGKRMWSFLEKLLKVTLPRVRDFRGLPPDAFDGQGNYSIGLKEHLAFPEIRPDEVEAVHGLQITLNTTAKSKEEGKALLDAMGFPFKKPEERGRS